MATPPLRKHEIPLIVLAERIAGGFVPVLPSFAKTQGGG
jgi:hypothetical protein